MLFAVVLISLSGGLHGSPQDTPVRNWVAGDPEVRFVEGTTSPGIRALGPTAGPVSISVSCIVRADGSLDACRVVAESEPRRLSHASARREVGKMRLELGETGPRPGDTLTVEAVVTGRLR